MSTQPNTVQASGFQSLTQNAISRMKTGTGAKRVLDAVSIPFLAVGDLFRGAAYLARRQNSPEVAVFEESQKPSADVREMQERCFNVLSQLQKTDDSNAQRAKYNAALLKNVNALSEFASKHSALDTLKVIKSVQKQIENTFGQMIWTAGAVCHCLQRAQLIGIKQGPVESPETEHILINGFITEAQNVQIGQIVKQKAIDELAAAVSKNPLSDEPMQQFSYVIKGLKELSLISSDEAKSALSGSAGQIVAETFSKAAEQVMTEAQSRDDLAGERKFLTSHASLLHTYGLKGVNMQTIYSQATANRQAKEVAQQAEIAEVEKKASERKQHLEQKAHDLQQRIALEQKVADASKKLRDLKKQLKALENAPSEKMAALIAKINAKPDEAELNRLLIQLGQLQKEAKQKLAQLKQGHKKSQSIQKQISQLKDQIKQAETELARDEAELVKFRKEHEWVLFPAFMLKRVQKELAKFEEGVPVQQQCRSWVKPILHTAIAITGLAAVATLVINRDPSGFGGTLARGLGNVWSYGGSAIQSGLSTVRGVWNLPVLQAMREIIRNPYPKAEITLPVINTMEAAKASNSWFGWWK